MPEYSSEAGLLQSLIKRQFVFLHIDNQIDRIELLILATKCTAIRYSAYLAFAFVNSSSGSRKALRHAVLLEREQAANGPHRCVNAAAAAASGNLILFYIATPTILHTLEKTAVQLSLQVIPCA